MAAFFGAKRARGAGAVWSGGEKRRPRWFHQGGDSHRSSRQGAGDRSHRHQGDGPCASAATTTRRCSQFKTVSIRADIDIVLNAATAPGHPGFRVVTQGIEIGSRLYRRSESCGKDVVSLTLAAPEIGPRRHCQSFVRAVGQDEDNLFTVIRHPSKTSPALAPSARGPFSRSVLFRRYRIEGNRASMQRRGKTRRCMAPYLFYDCRVELFYACRFPACVWRSRHRFGFMEGNMAKKAKKAKKAAKKKTAKKKKKYLQPSLFSFLTSSLPPDGPAQAGR